MESLAENPRRQTLKDRLRHAESHLVLARTRTDLSAEKYLSSRISRKLAIPMGSRGLMRVSRPRRPVGTALRHRCQALQ